jgi:2-dehydropantoate 2-reductase
MRYIIYGAGGIGGTIGARLHQAGKKVHLIARGPHLEAIQRDGLRLADPNESVHLSIPVVAQPAALSFDANDVVMLCMKSQDTDEALKHLVEAAGPSVPVVCCQNGVDNERMALRRFDRVYGMPVILPATHLEPGLVLHHCKTIGGILDIGRFPSGIDTLAEKVASDLRDANFSSFAHANVMRWKYAKLLQNLGNSLQALCAAGAESAEIYRAMIHEALECYRAARIECASRDEVQERRGALLEMAEIEGYERVGGSSLQSILRGSGSIESDFLNGEIALLGRLHGVPVPVNSTLQFLANRLALSKGAPGSMPISELRDHIDAAVTAASRTDQ